jgi:hypothetical protein
MKWLVTLLSLLACAHAQAQPITGLGMVTPWTSARVLDDQSYTNTTLADVPGLTLSLQAGHTYAVTVSLSYVDVQTGNNGGIAVTFGGTVVPSNIIFDGWQYENSTLLGQGQGTALGQVVAGGASNATIGHLTIIGTITVAQAGTLTVQAAQFSSNAIPTVIKQGSLMLAMDIP